MKKKKNQRDRPRRGKERGNERGGKSSWWFATTGTLNIAGTEKLSVHKKKIKRGEEKVSILLKAFHPWVAGAKREKKGCTP